MNVEQLNPLPQNEAIPHENENPEDFFEQMTLEKEKNSLQLSNLKIYYSKIKSKPFPVRTSFPMAFSISRYNSIQPQRILLYYQKQR